MSRVEELAAITELGEEAKAFLSGNLGKCLLGMAEQEVKKAILEFKDADPNDRAKIASLQDRVRAGTWFSEWLEELVVNGEQALQVFMHESKE